MKIKRTLEEIHGIEKANAIKDKMKNTRKDNKNSGTASTLEREELRRQKISSTAKKNKKSGGRRIGSGRGKKGWYKGFFCDSSWELAWVIYHIDNDILFERNHEYFDYSYEEEMHKFYPDFIKENIYYELKGYKTKQVEAKISQFPHKIVVLFEKDLKYILEYVIEKYGKNFISLYDGKKYLKICVKCENPLNIKTKGEFCYKCYKRKVIPKNLSIKLKKEYKLIKKDECSSCGKLIKKYKTGLCKNCYKQNRKFEISKNELEKLINEYPYEKIGKMFNVSGQAIKRRAKKLEITLENRKGYWAKVNGERINKERQEQAKHCKDCNTKLGYKNKSGYCQKCIGKYNSKNSTHTKVFLEK